MPGAGNPQAWNRYAYTLNNPVNFTDPSGNNPKCGPDGIFCDNDESNDADYLPMGLPEWVSPVENPIINGGYDWGVDTGSDYYGNPTTHPGVDFNPPHGTPIFASGTGTVHVSDQCALEDCDGLGTRQASYRRDAEINGGYGNVVVVEYQYWDMSYKARSLLEPGQSLFFLYGHLDSINVSVGDSVSAGDIIGIVGDSGNSFGVHLHLEIRTGSPGELGFGDMINVWWEWRSMNLINPHDIFDIVTNP